MKTVGKSLQPEKKSVFFFFKKKSVLKDDDWDNATLHVQQVNKCLFVKFCDRMRQK